MQPETIKLTADDRLLEQLARKMDRRDRWRERWERVKEWNMVAIALVLVTVVWPLVGLKLGLIRWMQS